VSLLIAEGTRGAGIRVASVVVRVLVLYGVDMTEI